MNRPVCPRDKIDLENAFFEGEERSSRTQGGHAYGVVNSDRRTSSKRPSTRLLTSAYSSHGVLCFTWDEIIRSSPLKSFIT